LRKNWKTKGDPQSKPSRAENADRAVLMEPLECFPRPEDISSDFPNALLSY